jgi:hypothetical protein
VPFISLEILVMTLLVFPSYTTSPTLPTKLAVVKGLTPEQQAPLPGWVPIPIDTGIFFEPVPLILKLTRSALGIVSTVADVTSEEENQFIMTLETGYIIQGFFWHICVPYQQELR